jgi:hypothetical protein
MGNQINKELYNDAVRNPIKLSVPKYNSLTDTMMRTTLGCEDKYYLIYVDWLSLIFRSLKTQQKDRINKKGRRPKWQRKNLHNQTITKILSPMENHL